MKVIEVCHLSKAYNHVEAVKDVSFSLDQGKIYILVGPNGAGKTTILKCIVGLLKKTKGVITIMGCDSTDANSRKDIAYIPEIPQLYPKLTVNEHLKFIALAYNFKNKETEIDELLKKFDLLEKKNDYCDSLSKGMKQKVSICLASLHHPSIYIVDEPMIGLDPKAMRELKDTLLQLKNEGATILMSTHLLDAVETLADEIIVVQKGKLLFKGNKDQLRQTIHKEGNTSLEDLFLEVTSNGEK